MAGIWSVSRKGIKLQRSMSGWSGESHIGSLGGKLPAVTVYVIMFSQFLQHYWFILTGIIIAVTIVLFVHAPANKAAIVFICLMLMLTGICYLGV